MDPRRRVEVFETSLRTSSRALRAAASPAKHEGLPAAR
jgi:hypothetical protein